MNACNEQKTVTNLVDINQPYQLNTLSINCIDITHRLYSGLKRLNYTLSIKKPTLNIKIDAKNKQ